MHGDGCGELPPGGGVGGRPRGGEREGERAGPPRTNVKAVRASITVAGPPRQSAAAGTAAGGRDQAAAHAQRPGRPRPSRPSRPQAV